LHLAKSTDETYLNHPIIQRFGSPSQPIYVDQCNVDINGVSYDNPLILPIYDGQLNLVQCAVLQDGQRVQVMPDGLAKGFARYGHFDHAEPIIITYNLEAFFKIAQTGYAVALVYYPVYAMLNILSLSHLILSKCFRNSPLEKAGYTSFICQYVLSIFVLKLFKASKRIPTSDY
jgi:hypothetical protein